MNFGVPAAYFYALGASLPTQMTPPQRYQLATIDQIDHVLALLTSAIASQAITDSESFTSLPAATTSSINAAQAARRLAALAIPNGSTTALAPLDTLSLLTNSDTPSGKSLPFNSTGGISSGMTVTGTNIQAGTTVSSFTSTAVTLSQAVQGDVPQGTAVTFAPVYTADLQQLVQAWLAYPASVAGATSPSSATYQPSDDAAVFWPGAASAHAAAFLNLVLCSLTQGYIIPAPFNVSLGDKVTGWLPTLQPPSPPPPPRLSLRSPL